MLIRNISIFTVYRLLCCSLLFAQDIEEEKKNNPQQAYRDAYREALSDGKIDENEAGMLKVLETALGLSSAEVIEIQSSLLGQDVEQEKEKNSREVYGDAYREALSDGKIDGNEARMLNVLENALGLSSTEVLEIQSSVRETLPAIINKEGEWLIFVQNIGWGLGLYGWGFPYVLGAGGAGILGGELMAPFISYKLTAKMTRELEMDHARAQLIRWGSTIGFRYALFLNKMRKFEPDNEFGSDDELDKARLTLLMLGVPVGSFAGDWVWKRTKPSTGHAFLMTFWSETGATVMRTAHSVIETEPIEPLLDYSSFPYDFAEYDREIDRWKRDKYSWERKHNLFSAVGYPLGMWLAYRNFKERQYSFGDAVLIQSMGLYGWGYGAIFTDLIGIDFDDKSAKVIRTAGTVALPILADRQMVGKNYSFGQSVLIAVGGVAGGMFTSGILALFEVQSAEAYEIAALGGMTYGLYYANSRLNVSEEYALAKDNINRKVFRLQPAMLSNKDGTHIPGLNMNILF